jgi:hypothetical protein
VIPSFVTPLNINKSAFFSMIHMLVDIPLNNVKFDKELKTIHTIAANNRYNIEMVDDI